MTDTERVLKEMQYIPEGSIFTAHSDGARKAFSEIAPIFEFWMDPEAADFPVRISAGLSEKITSSKAVLRAHGIRRQIRFEDLRTTVQDNGNAYRRWNSTGREWKACALNGTLLETYTNMITGEIITARYMETADIMFNMSRRLRPEEEAERRAKKKDKFGRKIGDSDSYYAGAGLKCCPSCGAELPPNIKDVECPYCGSTIFADYYDWQVESLEIEPEFFVRSILDIFRGREKDRRVLNKKENRRNKIVRFSENDFRNDVLESCIGETEKDRLVDLFLGQLEITKIRHTGEDTILSVTVPVYRTEIDADGKVIFSNSVLKTKFTRARYPNRFDKASAVLSAEKACPSCGAPFTPDEHGNCPRCGTFLFMDRMKWKKAD